MMLAMYIAVAYIRTESSIISNCLLGPIRNAVLPRAIKLPRVNVTPNFTGLKKTIIDWNNRHENCQIIHKGLNVGKYKVIITG
jgi:hypothetical protein